MTGRPPIFIGHLLLPYWVPSIWPYICVPVVLEIGQGRTLSLSIFGGNGVVVIDDLASILLL